MSKISNKGKKILLNWQGMGLVIEFKNFSCIWRDRPFAAPAEDYFIPEQPVPESVTLNDLCVMQTQGLLTRRDDAAFWKVRISAQPIPKELLEMDEPKKKILITHPAERMLWLQQRIAGTNEQWQVYSCIEGAYSDVPFDVEPAWRPEDRYRVKPKTVKHYFCLYRPKTSEGRLNAICDENKDNLIKTLKVCGATIISNIEEYDVEVE